MILIPLMIRRIVGDAPPPDEGHYNEPMPLPPWGIDIEAGGENINGYVRAIVTFNITYHLNNRAIMRCETVDPLPAPLLASAYRPQAGHLVEVVTKAGVPIFGGRILRARERSTEERSGFGASIDVDIVDHSEVLEQTYVDRTFGTDPRPILTVIPGTPGVFMTYEPHGFAANETVAIEGVQSTVPNVNGTHVVTPTGPNTFVIPGFNVSGGGNGGTARAQVRVRDVLAHLIEAVPSTHGLWLDPQMPPGPLIDKLTVSGSVDHATNEIARRLGWVRRVLPNRMFQMFEPGEKVAPFELNGQTILGSPEIERSRTNYANTIRATYGTNAVIEKTETWVANGSQRSFPLRYKPSLDPPITSIGQVVLFSAGNQIRHIGIWGQEPLFEFVYRHDTQSIEQLEQSAGLPNPMLPPGFHFGANIQVQFPQVVTVNDPVLAAPGGPDGGPRTRAIKLLNIFDYDAARSAALVELNHAKMQPRRVTIETYEALALPGMTVPINLPTRLLTGSSWLIVMTNITQDEVGFRYRYALAEDNVLQPGWIDILRGLAGGGSAGSITMSAPPSTPGGGGGGPGFQPRHWSETDDAVVIGANLSVTGAVVTGTLRASGTGIVVENVNGWPAAGVVGVDTTWRIASRLGTLGAEDIVLAPGGGAVVPDDPTVRLGRDEKKYLTVHAAELRVETLVAQQTIATIGGRVLVAPSTRLTADVAPNDTQIRLRHQVSVGDRLYLEDFGKLEIMIVTSLLGSGTDEWIYGVQRNFDGTGLDAWFSGDAVVNTGQIGSGFIDLYAIQAIASSAQRGPTIVGNVRTSNIAFGWEPRWALGRLDGLYGYPVNANIFGAGFGVSPLSTTPGAWLIVDAHNGLRMGRGGTTFVHITPSGQAHVTGIITVQGGNAALSDMSNVTVIDGGKIATGSITANKLNVTALSAISANLGNVIIGVNGALATQGVWWGGGNGLFLGWHGSNYGFRAGALSGQHIVWDGNSLEVWAGNIIINSGGLQVPFGTNVSGSRILVGTTSIHSQQGGWIAVDGALSFKGGYCQGTLDVENQLGVQGMLTAFGYLRTHGPLEFMHSAMYWQNAQSTTGNDQPLVWSPSNQNVYRKTNGISSQINPNFAQNMTFENGILVGVS